MKPVRLLLLILAMAFALSACQSPAPGPAPASPTPTLPQSTPTTASLFTKPTETTQPEKTVTTVPTLDAFAMNARLVPGINLGNALEAPKEGEWGVTLQAEYFQLIKEKGFKSVRVPIRWSAHAGDTSPYTIDPAFFERIDWVLEQARANNLVAVINMHHYDEFYPDPAGQRERFLALWKQIAEHYKDQPTDQLVFEPLNEPNGDAVTPQVWNDLIKDVLAVIRQSNPERFVMVGPVFWNSVDQLPELKLPKDDQRIIVTFHYYSPFNFTHQGAEWQDGSAEWLGTQWQATGDEKSAINNDFDKAVRWSKQNNRPIYLGEFGAYSKADMDSRARWTEYIARQAEADGFSWAYWEFCSGFGIYDPQAKTFRDPLVKALIP